MIKVVLCGYKWGETYNRCIRSITTQTYANYFFISEKEDTDSNRRYLVYNTLLAIEESRKDPEDIIVCIDADDFLCDEDAFKIILDTYKNYPNTLLTYGSYVNLSSNKRGKFCGEYKPGESFRNSDWRGSHIKTFKYKLWNALPKDQLKKDNGEWFKFCADRVIMTPMMELAGYDRIKYIDMLMYCYNDENPISVWKTNKEESLMTRAIIASRKPLSRLDNI